MALVLFQLVDRLLTTPGRFDGTRFDELTKSRKNIPFLATNYRPLLLLMHDNEVVEIEAILGLRMAQRCKDLSLNLVRTHELLTRGNRLVPSVPEHLQKTLTSSD